MGWLTGKSKSGSTKVKVAVATPRRQRVCGQCNNTGRVANFGLAPGGGLVRLPDRPCPGNH